MYSWKSFLKVKTILFILLLVTNSGRVFSQACTTLGQTPSTAFPVCGTTVFHQTNVPICATNDIFVPGCTGDGANYQNKNPFFYKFTCYVGGTLGFRITPLAADEDYDWQLYDITGRDPNEIFTNNSLVVAGNWSGTYGPTGAGPGGVNGIQCASVPDDNMPTFAAMPTLIVGHVYLLMISHYTDTQSGYDLSFGGGTGVITDPLKPHVSKVVPGCDGKTLTVTLNKKVLCSSFSTNGSDFNIPGATISSAASDSCNFSFDFDEILITLNAPLTNGTHQLVAQNGTDGNTLIDNCGNIIPVGESFSFDYFAPQPIRADSVGKPRCTPDSLLIYYPKKIRCSTISPNGADFSITGPTAVTITGASGNCVNDLTDYVVLRFAAPIYTKGTYTLNINPGVDGSPIFDLCGQPILGQSLSFTTADTVNALYTYSPKLGCRSDTLVFSHNGAHDVNSWSWIFNNGTPVTTQSHTVVWPASSSNTIQLIVSNGVCRDTASSTVLLDNEVKAGFTMPPIICPEDGLQVTDTSKGHIDSWTWTFDRIATSNLQNPGPVMFPMLNHEAYYTVKLVVRNNSLNCADSTRKSLTVLDHCLIAVPTAFTPNNDGLNDTFSPHNAIKADNYQFKIYNRWGQLVFQSTNWQDKWDGRVNGQIQGTNVYVWMLSYTHRETKKQVFQKGTVLLIK